MEVMPPCKNCADRTIGCHARCNTYKDWAAAKRALRKEKNSWKNTRSRLTIESAKTTHSATVLRNKGRRY